jgi:hypothetical protein
MKLILRFLHIMNEIFVLVGFYAKQTSSLLPVLGDKLSASCLTYRIEKGRKLSKCFFTSVTGHRQQAIQG